jgi:hypothetical protein
MSSIKKGKKGQPQKRKPSPRRTNESKRSIRLAKSKAKAVKWLTKKPKPSDSPLEEATLATREVVWGINQINSIVSLDEILESVQTILAAMYTSAGVEYPDSIAYLEAPTEEEVEWAYGNLSYVDNDEGAFEYLTRNLRCAIDVVEEWYSGYHPDKYSDDWDADDEDA